MGTMGACCTQSSSGADITELPDGHLSEMQKDIEAVTPRALQVPDKQMLDFLSKASSS